jgi:hypothetical protein
MDRLFIAMFALLCLFVSTPVNTHAQESDSGNVQDENSSARPLEENVVTDPQNFFVSALEGNAAENDIFGLFQHNNSSNKIYIKCRTFKYTGSHIRKRVCEPISGTGETTRTH